eukprot:TRINITY_DN14951_c0_g1_i2.p1 TRINITY_DN14951_c0_g1~~TRINITY_DN14951_c0_g1_i2.p1  ORF type:complete len:274 (-),score=32.69 TRINITY_DN14951_c0_g1_i2:2-823(-)
MCTGSSTLQFPYYTCYPCHNVQEWEANFCRNISYVLQVGDIECHRNDDDLSTMAAPAKHRRLGDFPDYFCGRKSLPWPVLFIGGNHECYGWLEQFPDGNFLAPNLFYFGRSSFCSFGGIAIAAISGIFRGEAFTEPRPDISLIKYKSNKDFIGFNCGDIAILESAVDEADRKVDILLSHDWPSGLVDPSEEFEYEKQDTTRELGNPHTRHLMDRFEPKVVLCGHMHASYRKKVGETQVCCLAKVPSRTSLAVFEVTAEGAIVELPGLNSISRK